MTHVVTDRNEEIVKFWNQNYTSSEIASCLKISRNTVIGVVTRARKKGLVERRKLEPMLVSPTVKQVITIRQTEKRSHRKQSTLSEVRATSMPKLFQKDVNAKDHGPLTGGVSFMDLEHGQCKFPTRRFEEQHYFCGAPRRDATTSYCEEHHEKAHMKKRRYTPEEMMRLQRGYALKQWVNGANAAHMKARRV